MPARHRSNSHAVRGKRNRLSARRVTRQAKKLNGNKPSQKWKLFRWLILLAIPLVIFTWLQTTTKYWSKTEKIAVAINKEDRGVDVVIFDPARDEITTITIPGNTEVVAARGLGTWRLSSIAKLGEREGLGGKLLTETMTNYFKFPVYTWASESFESIVDGEASSLPKIFSSSDTNLGLGDRMRMYYFALTLKNYRKDVIDLTKTKYLDKVELIDGDMGYKVTQNLPAAIAALFVRPELSDSFARVKIVDGSGEEVSDKLGSVIEVMGAKVASVEISETTDKDCFVRGRNTKTVGYLSRVFGCDSAVFPDSDLMIEVGKKFADRF